MRSIYSTPAIILLLILLSCSNKKDTIFSELSRGETGIDFRNLLIEDESLNISHYIYFYNGGGVAIGDINNDGLNDIFFSGNMVKNRLYLNKGGFNFENITDQSHVAEKQGWCTGANMVDINQDGLMDIYVCRSADDSPERRKNLLFVNNGDATFTEQAEKYGLADNGYSTQSAFFDFDKDGDLDCFILNHSVSKYSTGVADNPEMRNLKNPDYASRLYRNDNGHFTEVSEPAGIVSNVLSFGLGLAISDFNNDGWPDIYISNDFKESDYLYLNNKNGTFTESFAKCMDLASLNSMGSDAADFNNDGLTDLVTLDMLSEDNNLQKTHASSSSFDKTNFMISKGFQPQYIRNMLQKNNGDGTFSEIGQLAGVSNTDWSWSALFCDFDGDTNKDLFISNGFVKDFSDLDFINFSADKLIKASKGEESKGPIKDVVAKMPTIKISNYLFKNTGTDKFENATKAWGLYKTSISAGAAYADLDNDGDMDLVINNTNEYASVYENNAETITKNNYLRINLKGTPQNRNGLGTKVKVYAGNQTYYQEQFPSRGYQSSVDMTLNFGLGKAQSIDSVLVVWPTDASEVIRRVAVNQTLTVVAEAATAKFNYTQPDSGLVFVSSPVETITHSENPFNDFTVQRLLTSYLSRQGPCLATADINNDGRKDVFAGNGKGAAAQLYLQGPGASFTPVATSIFNNDLNAEITDAVFFDADGDSDPDLYVAHGGYEFSEDDPALQDNLYFNNGKGSFSQKASVLPPMLFSKSCVRPADIDNDGDLDLFVGGRLVPGKYPVSPPSRILLNDGKGNFSNATSLFAPSFDSLGMVTDASWIDVNRDNKPDLVVVGEWMPVKIFLNSGNRLTDVSKEYIRFESAGWWNRLVASDIDGDGDQDLVIGNAGLNTQFVVNETAPISVTYSDFDKNGSMDPLLCYFIKGTSYPAASRDDLAEQIPSIKKNFLTYKSYSDATLKDIFSAEQLAGSRTLKAGLMETVYLENKGGQFELHHLPLQAQYSPVYGIVVADMNGDKRKDILLVGNNTWTRIKFGRYTANHGVLLAANAGGAFDYVPQTRSGLKLNDNIRSAVQVNDNSILLGINDKPAVMLQFNIPPK